MSRYKIKNYENGEVLTLTMEELLFEINRDRSNEWIDYTEEELQDPKMIEEALSLTDYSLMDVI